MTDARQLAYLRYHETHPKLSFADIARVFQRDRKTVTYGIAAARRRQALDAASPVRS